MVSRVGVIGAGAIGGWVAAKLALAGQQVSVLARGESLAALQTEGLILSERAESCRAEVRASSDADELGGQDLLVIAVKAPALAQAAAAARPMIGSETKILPMLNGVPWWFTQEPLHSVDPNGTIGRTLPIDQVVGCVVHASCRRSAPNRVEVVHADKLILGEVRGGASERVAALCNLFEEAGIRAEPSDNVRRAIWYKLWGNATINPLSALTRATADELLRDAAVRSFMAEAMDELAIIGAAVDCPIAESSEDRMAVTARLGAFKTSMLQDVEADRPIELDALVGAPLEIARRHGIAAPQLGRIYALTRLLSENLRLV